MDNSSEDEYGGSVRCGARRKWTWRCRVKSRCNVGIGSVRKVDLEEGSMRGHCKLSDGL